MGKDMRDPLCPAAPRNNRSAAMRALLLALALPLLAACASGPAVLRTELTSYHEWPAGLLGNAADKTYVFVAPVGVRADGPDAALQAALEHEVAEEMARQGFRKADRPGEARLAVAARARITSQVRYVAEPFFRDPFWRAGPGRGVYGGYGGFWHPPGWYGGFAGYRDFPVTVYQRVLTLTIDDLRQRAAGGAPRHLYEGTVESTGVSNALAAIAPYLVRALFMDFPGANGQTRTIDVPVDSNETATPR